MTRHLFPMRMALCFFFAARGWAQDATDQVGILGVLSALNEVHREESVFARDADGAPDLERLQAVPARLVVLNPLGNPSNPARVVISHEPFGEAVLVPPRATTELTNPRITAGTVRFITPDVAVAEASYTYREGANSETAPLLVILKRDGKDWKIASFRVLAKRP